MSFLQIGMLGLASPAPKRRCKLDNFRNVCLIVLLVLPLQDNQGLVGEGSEAVISMRGCERDACLDKLLVADNDKHSGGIQEPRY